VWERQTTDNIPELHARVAELEQQLDTALGILGLIRPATTVLTRCDVKSEQQEAFFRLIDEMTRRAMSGSSVSYSEFEERVGELVPGRRDDRKFFEVLIEAVKLECPESKPMLEYVAHVMTLYRS
jgi:hypothetical protein